jgi:arabinan endo-1,5-alpha-L-arabinosidase
MSRRPKIYLAASSIAALLLVSLLLLTRSYFQPFFGGGPKDCPDPAIITAPAGDLGYYVFSTCPGICIWYSTNLTDWKKVGHVFEAPVPQWAKAMVPTANGVWAPDISFHDGLYYLYYAVSGIPSQHSVIGLAVNQTITPSDPLYRWEDRGLVVDSVPNRDNFNAIDPALFVDTDGQWYLFFGSFFSGIKALRVDPKTGKPSGKPFGASNPMLTVAARPNTWFHAIEGAYVIRRGDFNYLFVSWDFCCAGARSNYKVAVGRSRKITGPYLDRDGRNMVDGGGTLVLEGDRRWRGPGHNSVLTTADGQWLVYHAFDANDPAGGRILQIRPISWSADGWAVLGSPLPVSVLSDDSPTG